jgi:hypothetical protein
MKVNWACTTAGSIRSKSNGSNFVAQAVIKRPAQFEKALFVFIACDF